MKVKCEKLNLVLRIELFFELRDFSLLRCGEVLGVVTAHRALSLSLSLTE